ncbi:hypothetical protein L9F63_008367, partial [Diploptera punctata]
VSDQFELLKRNPCTVSITNSSFKTLCSCVGYKESHTSRRKFIAVSFKMRIMSLCAHSPTFVTSVH